MEENGQEKKGLFKKIADKWAKIREERAEKKQSKKEKIKEKFTKTKTKLAVTIGSLALAGAMALAFTHCGILKNNQDINDVDDTDINYETTVDQDDVGQNNPGYVIPGESTNTNTKPNTGNKETDDLTETEPQKEYSEALQYVLNNSEYNSLIAKAKREASSKDHPTYSTNFDSVPYGFFEQKGFDVSALKNDTLANFGVPFFRENEPNNLYVCASAETNAAQPYLTQYILKYELTDKEAEEFKWLHNEGYLQAFFMVDAYSKMKTPEIINECKITTRAYDGLLTSLSENSVAKSLIDKQGLRDIIMLNFSQEEGKAQILLIGNTGSKTTTVGSALNVANISNGGRFIIEDANGAYDRSYNTGDYSLKREDNSDNCEFVTRYFKTSSYSNTQILQQ